MGVLSESKDRQSYWRKLKQRLKEEGNETVTNCHALKLKAADGKYRLTDVVDIENNLGDSIITNTNKLNYEYIEERELK